MRRASKRKNLGARSLLPRRTRLGWASQPRLSPTGPQLPLPFKHTRPLSVRARRILGHAILYLEFRHLKYPEKTICNACGGQGIRSMNEQWEQACFVCKGKGWLLLVSYHNPVDIQAAKLLRSLFNPMASVEFPLDLPYEQADCDSDIENIWKMIRAKAKEHRTRNKRRHPKRTKRIGRR